jgi:hypothetical protein
VRDKSTKQVASAAGEGASAALMIREYLFYALSRLQPSMQRCNELQRLAGFN